MANLRNLILPMEQACGGNRVILVEVSENYAFHDGQRGERQGMKYRVACPGNFFDVLTVKINTNDPSPIEQEDIAKRNAAGQYVYCTFEGFGAKIWVDSGNHTQLSATADKITLLNVKQGG